MLPRGHAKRHGFEYKRNGTLSLYAALNTKTGQVQGRTAARHTSQEFVAFLKDVVERCAPDRQIHIICDNLLAHKTQHVDAFLATHPSVLLHFTPTYSAWLNEGKLWFSKLQREVIARGIHFSSKLGSKAFVATSMPIRKTPSPFSGNTLVPGIASVMLNVLYARPLVSETLPRIWV